MWEGYTKRSQKPGDAQALRARQSRDKTGT